MSNLRDALESGKFGVTAEMAPPKGFDFTEQLEAAELLAGKVHAVNVTDMQSASLKASGIGLCIKLKQAGVDPILQITGRDRNRMAIMGDVLSAASFGIDTMLALTGDHPVVGDCKQSKPVYEPRMLQINKLRQKVEAGARYIQTQGIFDMDSLKRFMDDVAAAGIDVPIMAGIIPLKAAGMAKFMNQNVPGIDVPQSMIDRLEAAAAEGKEKGVKGLPMKLGMEMAAEMIAKIKEENICPGVHIMAIGAEKNVPAILEMTGI